MSQEQRNINAVVTLQHVVANFLNEINEYTQENYKRYLQIAVRGFSNLNMTSLRSYAVAYMTIDNKGQVRFPDDFVDYTKIGVNMNGKLYVLSLNTDIVINRETQNGEILNESYNVEDVSNEAPIAFMPHVTPNGVFTDQLYGLAYNSGYSQSIPMFNIDYTNKVLQLSSQISASKLIVEYVSTGVSMNGNTYVPRYVEEALIEFLYWRSKKADPKSQRGEVMDAKMDYLEAVNVLESLESVCTYQEAMDAIYSTAKQTIKR